MTIRAWNSLPEETKQAPSVASFKHRLNRDLNKPPIYFNAGTREGQIQHTRLRLECSSLNSHLYRKNLVPELTCQCGAFESSYHYLFVCPRYANVEKDICQKILRTIQLGIFARGTNQYSPRKWNTVRKRSKNYNKNWKVWQMKRCNTI